MTPPLVDLYPPVSALYAYEARPVKSEPLEPCQLVCRVIALRAPAAAEPSEAQR